MTFPVASNPSVRPSIPPPAAPPVSQRPGGTSEVAAGTTAAAEATRVQQAIQARFTDGFEDVQGTGGVPPPGLPNLTGVSAPTGAAPVNAAPTSTAPVDPAAPGGVGGTVPMEAAPTSTDPAASGSVGESAPAGAAETSGVPYTGDPMLDQWDPIIAQEAAKWGVPPANLKALIAVESGGDPNAVQINEKYGNTYGLCQINPAIWGETAAARGYDIWTPEGNIGFAASLLRDHYDTTGSWDQAHSMYFNPAGTGDSVNGTSNADYVAQINAYINAWT